MWVNLLDTRDMRFWEVKSPNYYMSATGGFYLESFIELIAVCF